METKIDGLVEAHEAARAEFERLRFEMGVVQNHITLSASLPGRMAALEEWVNKQKGGIAVLLQIGGALSAMLMLAEKLLTMAVKH
jgi:hypothetical protein